MAPHLPCPGCAAKRALRAVRAKVFPLSELRRQLHALGLHGFNVQKGFNPATGEHNGWIVKFRSGVPVLPPTAPTSFSGLPVRFEG